MNLSKLISLTGIIAISSTLSPLAFAEGGFIGLQGSYVKSRDMDTTNPGIRITVGPRITERLSLEMSFFDMGAMENDDPRPNFVGADTNTPPKFTNAGNGSVTSTPGTSGGESSATYTGFSGMHAQSILLQLSYAFPIHNQIDLFVKGGANIWWADYDSIEIVASSGGGLSRDKLKTKNISAMDGILGGGLLWKVAKNASIRAEFESTSLDTAVLNRNRLRIYSIGAQFEF